MNCSVSSQNLLALKEKELQSIDRKLSSLQQSSVRLPAIGSCDNEYSLSQDSSELTQTVNALATLPRRPKHSGKKTFLSMFRSNSHLNTIHSSPELLLENISNGPQAPIPVTAANSQLGIENSPSKPQSCLYNNRSGDLLGMKVPNTSSQLGTLDGKEHSVELNILPDNVADDDRNNNGSFVSHHNVEGDASLDSHSQSPVSSRIYMSGEMSPGQYNSLPVRGTKNRPTSLLIPSITIRPVKHNSGRTDVVTPSSSGYESSDLLSDASESHVSSPGHCDCNTKRALDTADIHMKSPSAVHYLKAGFRPISLRGSFRHSMSPALGLPYVGSSNHVLTEHNSRLQFDPELIRIRQGQLDLQSPDYLKRKQLPTLFRSISSPAMKVVALPDNKQKIRRSADDKIFNQLETRSDMINTASFIRMTESQSSPHEERCSLEKWSDATEAIPESVDYCDMDHVSNLTRNVCPFVYDSGDCKGVDPLDNCHSGSHCSLVGCCHGSQDTMVSDKEVLGYCDKNGNITDPGQSLIDCLCGPSDCHLDSLYSERCSKHLPLGLPRSHLCSVGDEFKSEPRTMSQSSSTASILSSQSNGSSEFCGIPVSVGPSHETAKMPDVFKSLAMASCQTTKRSTPDILHYTRYKDILQQNALYVNENDECTKL